MTKVTAADIRAALKLHFKHPDFGIVFEVARATGHGANRHLDAVAMDLWPSRGLELHGIEIKTSKADLNREIATPEKADEIARYCNRFWVAAPAGIADANVLPLSWGLLEFDGKELIPKKKAMAHPAPTDPGRPFLAAVFRAAGRGLDKDTLQAALDSKERAVREGLEDRFEAVRQSAREEFRKDAELWRAFLTAVGVPHWNSSLEKVVANYRHAALLDRVVQRFRGALAHSESVSAELRKALASVEESNAASPASSPDLVELSKGVAP